MHFLPGLGGYTSQDATIMPLLPQQQQRQWRQQIGNNSDGGSHDGDSGGHGDGDGNGDGDGDENSEGDSGWWRRRRRQQ